MWCDDSDGSLLTTLGRRDTVHPRSVLNSDAAGAAVRQVRPANIPTSVADELRRQIRQGGLQPGDRLPGNRELTATFGVSMGSVREAISMLVSEGLIETRAGRGTYVARGARLPQLPPARRGGGTLERKEVEELIEAREALELQIVAMAAQRASAAQVAKLQAIVERMQAGVVDPALYGEADVEFHLALAEAAGNRFLFDAMAGIRQLLRRELELSAEVGARRFGNLQFSVDSHRLVTAAIEAGDPEAARAELFAIMSRHHEFVLSLYAAPQAVAADAETGTAQGQLR